MSTAQETNNKAAFIRVHDAVNTCDAELISKTIDEVVEPDALIRTPLPIEATGAQWRPGGCRCLLADEATRVDSRPVFQS